MIRVGLIGLPVLTLTGCSGMSSMMKELASDPASACISVQSPYGAIAVGRAVIPGVKVIMSAGQCTIEHRVAE